MTAPEGENMQRLWIVLFAPLMFVGCATMNRSECQNADWRMIGMEDGVKGRAPDYVGQHRQACAKYNVTPDLTQYRKGQEEGIRQFCCAAKGFELGQKNIKYNGVCPPDLEPLFLENYNRGSQLRMMAAEIDEMASHIDADQEHLQELKKELKAKEDQLIYKGDTETQRSLLLREIKELQKEIDRLKETIRGQEQHLNIKRMEYEQFAK